ncbi:hypothetical protein A9Q99_02180 [Gammaproteobacteria bacterium 45_16_T64]|nr:hypothetical protein A9Q99_02180 [Gammaproteobacteria bacterium 45_16_T64]
MSGSTFNDIIAGVKGEGGEFKAQIPATWMQGRATFGGLVAAVAVEALRKTLGDNKPLRAIQVLFVAPVGIEPIDIKVKTLREGRNVTSMQAEVIQEGGVCCSVLASFGAARESVLSVSAPQRPKVSPPEELSPFVYVEGKTPGFTKNFDMRWAKGARPFSACKDTEHGIWTRFTEPGAASILHLIALADIPPPIGISMLSNFAPGSSLTWSLEFVDDIWEAQVDDWWYIKTELAHMSHGYGHQEYEIWAPDGKPVALGRQVMTVFA